MDRETNPKYFLQIEAIDVIRINTSAICLAEIDLDDVNDTPPIFEKFIYEFYIIESTMIGSLIGEVKALDLDINLKGNNFILYSIKNHNKSGEKFFIKNVIIYSNFYGFANRKNLFDFLLGF